LVERTLCLREHDGGAFSLHHKGEYVELREALRDFLKESEVTLDDLLAAMDEEKHGLLEALNKRVSLSHEDSQAVERPLSSRELNLLLFVIQAFYITSLSGLYKGKVIYPVRRDVVRGAKATLEGLKHVGRALGVHINL